jgi:hypothetical protein
MPDCPASFFKERFPTSGNDGNHWNRVCCGIKKEKLFLFLPYEK